MHVVLVVVGCTAHTTMGGTPFTWQRATILFKGLPAVVSFTDLVNCFVPVVGTKQ